MHFRLLLNGQCSLRLLIFLSVIKEVQSRVPAAYVVALAGIPGRNSLRQLSVHSYVYDAVEASS